MTTSISLSDPKVFFDEIATPSFDEFMSTNSTFRTAFNAVTALFHLHEWVWEFKRPEIEAKFSQKFTSHGVFWSFIESRISHAGFIRDLTNASKHVKISRHPSTGMTHIANTTIQTVGFGQGNYGMGRYSSASVVMKEGQNDIYLDDCLKDLFQFWSDLITYLYP